MTKRNESIEWAQKLIESGFVVLDMETTDINATTAEPVQIAIIDSSGHTLLNTLVKPDGKMSPIAANIHGITAEKLETAPILSSIHEQVQNAVKGRSVAIFNQSYDKAVLDNCCARLGLPTVEADYHCAMLESAKFFSKRTSLAAAAHALDIQHPDAHDAQADCLTTLAVIAAIARTPKMEPAVYELEPAQFVAVLPDETTHEMVSTQPGAKLLLEQSLREHWLSRQIPPTPPVEVEPIPKDEHKARLEAYMDMLREYGRLSAKVTALLKETDLKKKEDAIKAEYQLLKQSEIEMPDFVSTSDFYEWDYNPAILVALAKTHAPYLINETINEDALKPLYEMGQLDWAQPFLKRVYKPRIAMQKKQLEGMAALVGSPMPVIESESV